MRCDFGRGWSLLRRRWPGRRIDVGDSSRSSPGEPTDHAGEVLLRGPDSVQQLAIDGSQTGKSQPRDITRRRGSSARTSAVASVDETGLITARGDGTAKITVQVGRLAATFR